MKNHANINEDNQYIDIEDSPYIYRDDKDYTDELNAPIIRPPNCPVDIIDIKDGTAPPIFINPVEYPYHFRVVYGTRNNLAKALGLTYRQMAGFEFWLGCMDRGYRNETGEVLLVREHPCASEPIDILINYFLPEAEAAVGELAQLAPRKTSSTKKRK